MKRKTLHLTATDKKLFNFKLLNTLKLYKNTIIGPKRFDYAMNYFKQQLGIEDEKEILASYQNYISKFAGFPVRIRKIKAQPYYDPISEAIKVIDDPFYIVEMDEKGNI